MNEQKWLKAKLPEDEDAEAETPGIGQPVGLYLCPHDRTRPWESDFGSLYYEEADGLVWGSAFGIHSPFDGVKFEDILKKYTTCFTEVPPLEAGRFPAPLGISCEVRDGVSRAAIRRIIDRLE